MHSSGKRLQKRLKGFQQDVPVFRYANLFDAADDRCTAQEFLAMVDSGRWDIHAFRQGESYTAIDRLVTWRKFSVLKALILGKRFDFYTPIDCMGRTICQIARYRNCEQLSLWLIQAGVDLCAHAKFTACEVAVIRGDRKEVKRQVSKLQYNYELERYGMTVIDWAVKCNRFRILQFFVRRGCCCHVLASAWEHAAAQGNLKMTQYLTVNRHNNVPITTVPALIAHEDRVLPWVLTRHGCHVQADPCLAACILRAFWGYKTHEVLDLENRSIGTSCCHVLAIAMGHEDFYPCGIDLARNPKIGDQAIAVLCQALHATDGNKSDLRTQKLEHIRVSDLSVRSYNRLQSVGRRYHIEIVCNFPSLLNICVAWVAHQFL
jgi:hypothetical protein